MLKLKEDAFKGNLWKMKAVCFPIPKVMQNVKTDFVSWEASAHHFPQLTCLYLKQCKVLRKSQRFLQALQAYEYGTVPYSCKS